MEHGMMVLVLVIVTAIGGASVVPLSAPSASVTNPDSVSPPAPTITQPPPDPTETTETTNPITGGNVTAGPPGIAILWGNLSSIYNVGVPTVSEFFVQNGVGVPISARLVLTLIGVSATSQLVLIAGNSPVLITCDSTGCIYTGTSWGIGVAEIGQCDISITMSAQVSFSWEVVAIWTSG